MKITSNSPIPANGTRVTSIPNLETFEGFYYDPDNQDQKVLLIGDKNLTKHRFGKDYYEVVVDGVKAFIYKVTIFSPEELDDIPEIFEVYLTDDYLRIEHPGFSDTYQGKVYSDLDNQELKTDEQFTQLKIREQYELGKSYPLRKIGDHLVFDETFLGAIDLEKKTIRLSADSKEERRIDLRQLGDEYVLNVNLKGGSWGNFFIRSSDDFGQITFERFDETKAEIIKSVTVPQSVISLVENQSTESGDDFLLLSPAPDLYKKLIATDGVLTGVTLHRFIPNKTEEQPVEEAEEQPVRLEELVNPKYWYVYVIVCLGCLILGLLSFIPLRLFS